MQTTNWKSFIRSLASVDAPPLTIAHWSIQQLEHIPSKSSFTHSAPPHMESRVAVNMRRPPIWSFLYTVRSPCSLKLWNTNARPLPLQKQSIYLVCKSFSIVQPCLHVSKIFGAKIEVPPLHSVAVFPSLSFGTSQDQVTNVDERWCVLRKVHGFFVLVGEQSIFRKQTCNKTTKNIKACFFTLRRIPAFRALSQYKTLDKLCLTYIYIYIIFMRSTCWQYLVWC